MGKRERLFNEMKVLRIEIQSDIDKAKLFRKRANQNLEELEGKSNELTELLLGEVE